MKDNKELYDELALECGEVVNENSYATLSSDKASEQIEKVKVKKKLAYDDGTSILPDNDYVNKQLDEALKKDLSKEEAMENMLYKTAVLKAQQEREEIDGLVSKEEALQQKKEILDYLMYQQEQAYFTEYKYVMDGKTKRRVRKMLERNWDKGMYRPNKSKLNG